MVKTRVHDLAAEFGVAPEQLLNMLKDMNIFVRSHLSALESDQVSAVRVRWEREKRRTSDEPAAKYTRAKIFSEKGKKTQLAIRFSTVIHSSHSPETMRDPRSCPDEATAARYFLNRPMSGQDAWIPKAIHERQTKRDVVDPGAAIAMGMLVCCRSCRNQALSSGGNGSSRKNRLYGSSADRACVIL